MKNAVLLILVITLQNCSQSFSQESDSIYLKYTSLADEKLVLRDGDYYDIENKPTRFELAPIPRGKDSILLVDIYRSMKAKNNEIKSHYYRTEVYVLEDFNTKEPLVLDLTEMFEDNKSRFLNTIGFKITACVVPKKLYLKLNSSSQCATYKELSIKYPM